MKQDGSFVSESKCIAQAIFLPHPRKCDVVSHLSINGMENWQCQISRRSKIEAGVVDGNIAELSPLPKHTQSFESRSVEKKHNCDKDDDITINSSNICCMVAKSWSMRNMKGYHCLVLSVITWLES